ncbi:MAG: hypothetical protein QOG64_2084 [Acidimicrobiaceae bacterium]|jgi:hypothetical protein|nr:hypothetical protein [Acidimicrobiaceae bacterium]
MIIALCRIVVGGLLLVSGTAKLRQPAWPATARQFGTPAVVVPLLPWLELVLGALLVAQIGGRWTALGALALLVVFTAAVGVQLARGRRVPCGCFGQSSTDPVSIITIARNVALSALTLVAVVGAR